jgi:protein-S-isoprenylcysteine O-methyltransferase Ste14
VRTDSSIPAGTASGGHVGVLVRLVAATLLFGALLFLLAGTVAWPAAWAYLAINVAILVVYSVILLRLHPDLIDERNKPPVDAKKWDKPLVAVVGAIGPLMLLVACGLDRRFHWSGPVSAAVKAVGLVLLAAGGALSNYAVAHNRFFSAVVRIQHDRGHRVIDTGPYQVLRHPGYVGSILHMTGTALALGSWWALLVSGGVSAVLAVRTAREDRTLRDELPGYVDYAAHVRYRLVPWVW